MKLPPPVKTFKSPGGRKFSIEKGESRRRWKDDPLWSDSWPILFRKKQVGTLFRNENYGKTEEGLPRWQASMHGSFRPITGLPRGIGYDVVGFDSPEQALKAWGRNADQIFDWIDSQKESERKTARARQTRGFRRGEQVAPHTGTKRCSTCGRNHLPSQHRDHRG